MERDRAEGARHVRRRPRATPADIRHRSTIGLVALVLAALALSLAPTPHLAGAASAGGAAAVVEPSRRPDAVVVTYREVLGEIGEGDRGPTLTIYGDGRMVTHYPRYMTRAGDYEQRLPPSELDQVLRSLVDKGLLDLDTKAARAATRASATAARQRAVAADRPITVFEAADAATTVIEVTVDRYRPSTGAREVRNLTKRVAWTNLRADAQNHPDVVAIRNLAAAEQELRALRERPGFARIP